MENIPVTTYRGFSAVSGETTFTQDMADIKNGKHAKLIIKIASLVAQGKGGGSQPRQEAASLQDPHGQLPGKKARTEHHPLQPRHHARQWATPTEVTSLRYTRGRRRRGLGHRGLPHRDQPRRRELHPHQGGRAVA